MFLFCWFKNWHGSCVRKGMHILKWLVALVALLIFICYFAFNSSADKSFAGALCDDLEIKGCNMTSRVVLMFSFFCVALIIQCVFMTAVKVEDEADQNGGQSGERKRYKYDEDVEAMQGFIDGATKRFDSATKSIGEFANLLDKKRKIAPRPAPFKKQKSVRDFGHSDEYIEPLDAAMKRAVRTFEDRHGGKRNAAMIIRFNQIVNSKLKEEDKIIALHRLSMT